MTVIDPPREVVAPAPRPPAHRRVLGRLLHWWRRLTAMRTAIILLFLLALAAIPGSLLPQRSLSQNQVQQYYARHPTLAPVLDRLSLFDVFRSPWFAAVYLLLFVSLIGCVLPRAVEHARALRTPPPPAPRHLLRLPDSATLRTGLTGPAALDVVEEELRVRRFRVVRRDRGDARSAGSSGDARSAGSSGLAPSAGSSGLAPSAGSSGLAPSAGSSGNGPELSAEKGLLKETGNLLFHLSLVALLLGLAGGKLWGYSGSILVTEGQGFCNSFQQYDTYSSGPLVTGADLTPLCIGLEDFRAQYDPNLTASSYSAKITYGEPGGRTRETTISVNHPLRLDGDRLYVTGHGFSPEFTVKLKDGTTFTDVSAPFLPSDQKTMSSQGALKLPDLGRRAGTQLALEGFFAPTGAVQNDILTSVDPRPLAPEVAIVAYEGYLGLDSGQPQSVYSLDAAQIQRGALKRVGAANLTEGGSTTLPDGTTITFTGFKEYAALQFSHDPGEVWVLGAAIALLAGLLGMLLLRRERFFARVSPAPDGGGTVLTVASLTRGSGESAPRFAALTGALAAAVEERTAAESTADDPARSGPSPEGPDRPASRTGGLPE